MNQLNVKALGLAVGITWGLGALLLGLAAWLLGLGEAAVEIIGYLYKGYAPTLGGTIIGTIWALVDGFICGAVIAWLYNKFSK